MRRWWRHARRPEETVVHCGLIADGMSVAEVFRCQVDHLSGISMRFGTYRRQNHHSLDIRLYRMLTNGERFRQRDIRSRSLVHELVVDAARLPDGGRFHFYFPPIEHSREAVFLFEASVNGAERNYGVTLWLASDESKIDGHIGFHSDNTVRAEFGLQATLITSPANAIGSYPEGLLYSPLSSCNLNCVHCISRHSRTRVRRIGPDFQEEMRERAKAGDLKWIFTDYSGDIFHAERKSPGQLDFLFGLGISLHIDTNGAARCRDDRTYHVFAGERHEHLVGCRDGSYLPKDPHRCAGDRQGIFLDRAVARRS